MSETRSEQVSDDLIELLIRDFHRAYEAWELDKCQFNSRSLVRVIFSTVEGLTYHMKQLTLSSSDAKSLFNDAELALLREESYELSGKGEAETRAKHLKTGDNVRFAFLMSSREFAPDFKLNLGDGGWEAFGKGLKVRHRITHPKDAQSLNLSVADIAAAVDGFFWFLRSLLELNITSNLVRLRNATPTAIQTPSPTQDSDTST